MMNILFGAQSGFVNIFQQVDVNLRDGGLVDKSAYLVSDSEYYLKHKAELPLIGDESVDYLYEWEYTSKFHGHVSDEAMEEMLEKYQSFDLWAAVVCDRRLMYGKHTKLRQDYSCHFSDEDLYKIVLSTLYGIEQLIKKVKADAIVTLIPATYGDYLLYFAALRNNIRYLQVKFTKVNNNVLLSESFGASTAELHRVYAEYIKSVSHPYKEEAIEYLDIAGSKPIQYEGALTGKKRGCLVELKDGVKAFGSVLKRSVSRDRSITRNDNHVPPIHSVFLYSHLLHSRNKKRALSSMCKRMLSYSDAEGQDYVFFPLHSEPEIALSVNGVSYQNQIELIRRLAQSLPFGYKLVVKEHPKSLGWRTDNYYLKLLKIPNLYFADMDARPYYWIKKSAMVATISGFVGFEAAILRVPVLVFGNVMFDMLPETMVLKVRDLSRLHETIVKLLRTYEYKHDAMVAYVSATMSLSVPVNVYSVLLRKQGRVTVGTNTDNVSEISLFTDYFKRVLLSGDGFK